MSTYMEILSESSYNDFLKHINDDMPYEEIHEFFEKAIVHETNFSDNIQRLYDVIDHAESFSDDFIENFNLKVYRMRKELLTEIIYNSTNVELRDKWNFALNELQFIDNYDYIYFFID